MATYLLTTAIGDLLGGALYSTVFRGMNRAAAMYICAALMLMNRFLFGWVVVATKQEINTTTMASEQDENLSSVANYTDDPPLEHKLGSHHGSESNGGSPAGVLVGEGDRPTEEQDIRQRSSHESSPSPSSLSTTTQHIDNDWLGVGVPNIEIL